MLKSASSIDYTAPAVFHFPFDISSPSSAVPKLFDKLVYSVLNFQTDVEEVFSSIFEQDPNCFAAQVLLTGFELVENLSGVSVERCHNLADKLGARVTDWESRWYNAVYTYKSISARQGCHILMDLLAEYPFDLLAVFVGYFWAFYSVDKYLMRDIVGRVLPFHPASHPYRILLESLYGFGLLETNSFEKGSKMIESAFQADPRHPFVIHNECHALEYNGRIDDALNLMKDERESYQGSSMEFHNTWHIAYFQLEQNLYDESMETFQKHLIDNVNSASRLSDACSLLWSLRMCNHEVDNSDFTKILVRLNDKITDHASAYFATHFAAALIGAEDYSGYNAYRHSVDLFMTSYKDHDIVKSYESFGLKMMDSLTAYALDDYSLATSKIYDVMDGITTLGGSQTQREFYYKLIYSSMLKMNSKEADKRLICLLNERSGYRELIPSGQRVFEILSKSLDGDQSYGSFVEP